MRPPIVLDSGAVIEGLPPKSRVRSMLRRAVEENADVILPAAVLAQTWRGGGDSVFVSRLLKEYAVKVAPHFEPQAKEAGVLLTKTGLTDAVDALVVAEASAQGSAVVLTSDFEDIGHLADQARRLSSGRNISVVPV